MSATPPNTEPSKNDTQQTATQAATRPGMTVEELLNFSFRDASAARIGNIVRRNGLSCS